nr:MAG TPA: hypothetical protein [Caudoviricetes sp.]
MKYFYTDRNLTDILPVDFKSFTDCGISTTNVNQVSCQNKVYSLIEIVNEELFNSLLKNEVTFMNDEEVQAKLQELRAIEAKELEEYQKNLPENQIKALKEELKSTQEALNNLLFNTNGGL